MLLKTFVSILVINGVLASGEKFFRRDYTYNAEYDAFYKLHWDDKSSTWEEAFLTCDDEGGKLFYPKHTEEWKVAANLSDSLVDVDNIFVGVRDEFGAGDFVSIEGAKIGLSEDERRQDEDCKVIRLAQSSNNYDDDNNMKHIDTSCNLTLPFICEMKVKV
ncbi:unnamed protein product, partial [Iphiclides podalirius]